MADPEIQIKDLAALPKIDLRGRKTVFRDSFKSFRAYHPDENPEGHWATAGRQGLDGSLRAKGSRRPLSLAEIDADPALILQHRAPKFGGPTALFTDDTVTAKGGKLEMTARWLQTPIAGRTIAAPRIWHTDHGPPRVFRYGFFEAKLRLSDLSAGAHAAFWLLSADGWTLEIDIMEHLGHWPFHKRLPDKYHTATHLDWNAEKAGAGIEGPPIHGVTRAFGCDWSREELVFTLDRHIVRRIPNTGAHGSAYMILNLAVDSPWSRKNYRGRGRAPVGPAQFPMRMSVDHVLVMQ